MYMLKHIKRMKLLVSKNKHIPFVICAALFSDVYLTGVAYERECRAEDVI